MFDLPEKSCCGCSPKDGVVILSFSTLIVQGIISAIYFLNFDNKSFFGCCWFLFPLVSSVLAIYGIRKNEKQWLIPYLVYRCLWVIFWGIILLLTIFISIGIDLLKGSINKALNEGLKSGIDRNYKGFDYSSMSTYMFFVSIMILALILLLESHFAKLVMAALNVMRDENADYGYNSASVGASMRMQSVSQ